MKVQSHPGLHWFSFALLCCGSRKLLPTLNQSGMKFKKPGNPELMVSLVLCFQEGCLFLFKVLLALCDISICSHWLL